MPNSLTLPRTDQAGAAFTQNIDLRPGGRMFVNGQGKVVAIPGAGAYTQFELLPAAVAAATADPHLLVIGTGTEVVTRADRGGVSLKSQATTPADGDNVKLFPAAITSGMNVLLGKSPRFQTQLAINSITALFVAAGLDSKASDNDVDVSALDGDGASFLFLPTGPGTTEITVDPAFPRTSVTSVTRDGTIATATTSTAHGLTVGDKVTLAGANQSYYNQAYSVISVPSATTFTVAVSGGLRTPEVRVAGYTSSITRNGTQVNANATVTILTTNLTVGMNVIGTGIPTGATIQSIGTGNIVLTAAATSSLENNSLRFSTLGVTSGSPIVTGLSSTTGLSPGDTVSGAGIPIGTSILSIQNSNQITLTAAATLGTNAVVPLTFGSGATGTITVNPYANWLCHQKVGGVDSFYKTNVAVAAGRDYDLVIEYDTTRVPKYYIDGELVATGAAGTSGATKTGSTTSGSGVVTAIGSTTGLAAGQRVTGSGIPAGTFIQSVDTPVQITLTQNATATATGVSLSIATSLGVNIGLELTGTPGGQKDIEVRYVAVGQSMG